MKKLSCVLVATFIFYLPMQAQIDSVLSKIRRFENGIFFRSITLVPVTSVGLIYFPHMQELIKSSQLDVQRYYNFMFNNPFELGVRSKDWFFSFNGSFPAYVGSKHFNQRLASATIGIERSLYVNNHYRTNLYVGLGYYNYVFSVAQSELNHQVAFQNLFQNQYTVTPDLRNQGAMLNIAGALAHLEKNRTSVGSYLRFGYCWGLQRRPWQTSTVTLTNVPRDRLGMVYLQLLLSISRNNGEVK